MVGCKNCDELLKTYMRSFFEQGAMDRMVAHSLIKHLDETVEMLLTQANAPELRKMATEQCIALRDQLIKKLGL